MSVFSKGCRAGVWLGLVIWLVAISGCNSSGSGPSAPPSPTPVPTAVPTRTSTATASPTSVVTSTATLTPTATPAVVSLNGEVLSSAGRNPVSGSTVTLYSMGPAGTTCSGVSCYGAHALQLAQGTSNSSGAFSLGFNPANCPAGAGADPTYVVASGGSTGVGSNSAIGLIALTGPCNGLTASSFVVVNELTTVAAEWALARFTDSTGTVVGSSSTNATGISNAVTLATEDLVVSYMSSGGNSGNTGIPAAFWANTGATVASCSSGSPAVNCDGLERLDTLANILASCINTNGPSSPQCSALLGAAGAATTTLAAAHAIASSPARNVAAIFAITPPAGMSLFQPTPSSFARGLYNRAELSWRRSKLP